MVGALTARPGLVLQANPPAGPDVGPAVGLGTSAIGTVLSTLLVGGILVALAPGYAERLTTRIREDAVGSFLYGLIALFVLIVVSILLAVTAVGLLLALPLLLLSALVWTLGAAVAFLAIGERLVGRDDGWFKPLVVGALINGGLTLTGIGGLVSFVVGAAGFGAVVRDWQE